MPNSLTPKSKRKEFNIKISTIVKANTNQIAKFKLANISHNQLFDAK